MPPTTNIARELIIQDVQPMHMFQVFRSRTCYAIVVGGFHPRQAAMTNQIFQQKQSKYPFSFLKYPHQKSVNISCCASSGTYMTSILSNPVRPQVGARPRMCSRCGVGSCILSLLSIIVWLFTIGWLLTISLVLSHWLVH